MDLQKMVNTMNENTAKDRSNYHLTYGELIEALKAAPDDAVVDERIKGVGSWRGSYIEIAIFTESTGAHWEDKEYTGDYGPDYHKWAKEHQHGVDVLPTNAHELAALLESILGKDFVGYKGGNFTIETWKPLWLEETAGDSSELAITGIDKDLKLITKQIEY